MFFYFWLHTVPKRICNFLPSNILHKSNFLGGKKYLLEALCSFVLRGLLLPLNQSFLCRLSIISKSLLSIHSQVHGPIVRYSQTKHARWLTKKQGSLPLQPQHSVTTKRRLQENQHRLLHTHARTHTVAQRGIALTLAHTDPLAVPGRVAVVSASEC